MTLPKAQRVVWNKQNFGGILRWARVRVLNYYGLHVNSEEDANYTKLIVFLYSPIKSDYEKRFDSK